MLPCFIGEVSPGDSGRMVDPWGLSFISGSTNLSPDPLRKVEVCSVEDAVCMGADAVSIHINFGNSFEGEMLRDLGEVSGQCHRWGVPLMVMAYVRGPGVENERDPEAVGHAARVAAELGADFVKVDYTCDPKSFSKVTKACPVPVVIAGGAAKDDDDELLSMISDALEAGARGVSIGRNVFQNKRPRKIVEAISALVHRGASLKKAKALLH